MSNKTLITLTIVSLVVAIGTGVLALVNNSISGEWQSCYADAVAIAESEVVVSEDLAEYTSDSVSRIIIGIEPNWNRMDEIVDEHWDNKDGLDDLEERC